MLKRGKFKEFTETIKHVSLIILIAAFYLFATQKGKEYSRITLVTTGILYVVASYIARIYWKKYLLTRGLEGKGKRSYLFLHSKGMVEEVVQNMLNKKLRTFPYHRRISDRCGLDWQNYKWSSHSDRQKWGCRVCVPRMGR